MLINQQNILKTMQLSRFKSPNFIKFDYSILFATFGKHKEIDQQTIYRIDLNWVNANKNLIPTTDQTLEGCNNYYLESCPSGALNVKSYTGVTLHNLYKGINLHYYEKQGQLKHDYIIAPNTDYKQIKLKV